ncbi:hypothetical protein M3N64_12770 [Sporolactobacillus sp. CPB3-1]|uniref:Fur-regulated basic protein FbpA n=1 Tax=Sporolactobacillus mangiferae TaxID=2940498 RepID=A0ABT0MEV4_9BACL|nr:hypothetical protein [Sporolactobacillus mangiferae]MCL1632794.1 hypothetical protein [Sporolactobacillus mangiferae]
MSGIEAMIKINNAKLVELKNYEQNHKKSLVDRVIYYAVVHEIEYLERQNRELEA